MQEKKDAVLEDKSLDGSQAEPSKTDSNGKSPAKVVGGPQFLPKILGQKITIRPLSGQPITGKLVGYNPYELLVESPKGHFLIFKHAVAAIEGGNFSK